MLRRGLSPSRPRPPKPSPLRGDGVTAHAATDEGSSFPRPAFSRRAGQAPPLRSDWKQPVPHRARYPIGPRPQRRRAHNVRPTNWPKAYRRGGFQPPEKPSPSGGKVSRRTPRRMRGLPFPVPLFQEGQDKLRPYMGRKGSAPSHGPMRASAPPQKTGAWGSVLLQIPPRPGSVLWEQLRLLGAQLLQDLLVRLGGQIQPLIEVGAAAAGTQDGLLPPPLVHLGVVA